MSAAKKPTKRTLAKIGERVAQAVADADAETARRQAAGAVVAKARADAQQAFHAAVANDPNAIQALLYAVSTSVESHDRFIAEALSALSAELDAVSAVDTNAVCDGSLSTALSMTMQRVEAIAAVHHAIVRDGRTKAEEKHV